jgi:gluconolactonase
MANPIPESFDRRVLASSLDHVGGVCWDAHRRCLWAGGEGGQLYRIGLFGTKRVMATIEGGALLGMALDKEHFLYVCDPGSHRVWRVDGHGVHEPFGEHIDHPNYPAFGPDGRLYVSDSGVADEATGQLFVIDPDGATTNITPRPLAYPTGLSVDATTLYVIESSAPAVSAMTLAGGPLEHLVEMESGNFEGLAMDGEGGLLISRYRPDQLWRWTASAGLDLLFEDGTDEYVLSHSNIAFYGERFDRLALTSLGGTNLVSVRLPFSGAPVHYPYVSSAPA